MFSASEGVPCILWWDIRSWFHELPCYPRSSRIAQLHCPPVLLQEVLDAPRRETPASGERQRVRFLPVLPFRTRQGDEQDEKGTHTTGGPASGLRAHSLSSDMGMSPSP